MFVQDIYGTYNRLVQYLSIIYAEKQLVKSLL